MTDPTGHSRHFLFSLGRKINERRGMNRLKKIKSQGMQRQKLYEKLENDKKLASQQATPRFKKLLSETRTAYENTPAYAEKSPSLRSLSNDAVPPSQKKVAEELNARLGINPNRVKRLPESNKIKNQLEHLENVAIRDNTGVITGFDALRINSELHEYLGKSFKKGIERIRKTQDEIFNINVPNF